MRIDDAVNIEDLHRMAKRRLPKVMFDYIEGDDVSFEVDVLNRLANDRQLAAYKHDQFWQCMDTLRDLRLLESLWKSGEAPWKTW